MNSSFEKYFSALQKMGISQLNDMQNTVIDAQEPRIGISSPTGSGKTLAFLLKHADTINTKSDKIQALFVAPTHDLVMQIVRVARDLFSGTDIRIGALGGNQSLDRQKETLKKRPHIVIGNPERISTWLQMNRLDFSQCRIFGVDEADALLPKKAGEDLMRITKSLPKTITICLFSATYSDFAKELAQKIFGDIVWKDFGNGASQTIEHFYCVVPERKLGEATAKLIRRIGHEKSSGTQARTLIFSPTGGRVLEIARELEKRAIYPATIDQFTTSETKKVVWEDLRKKKCDILVTTDASMRGIDIPDIDLIIHFKLPFDARDWQHRSGRTGRFGKSGKSVVVIEGHERPTFLKWCKQANIQAEEITLSLD